MHSQQAVKHQNPMIMNKEMENSMKLPQLDGVPLKVVKQMRPT